MRSLFVLFFLGLVLAVWGQDTMLETEGHHTQDDNGVVDEESTRIPNFILLCALIPQIPGCPCDPLLETRPTFYDFSPSDCSCYDSQQSGFTSSPCFCSKEESDECKCLNGLSSLDEEHDRMCIVSPLTYVTPYANCTSFLNPLGEEGLCNGDLEISQHCTTLRSCRRLAPISIEDSTIQDKCVLDPEAEGCPCSPDQLITDEDALICSCYRNPKNPGCPCDVEPESSICSKFTQPALTSTTSTTPSPTQTLAKNTTDSVSSSTSTATSPPSTIPKDAEQKHPEDEDLSQSVSPKNKAEDNSENNKSAAISAMAIPVRVIISLLAIVLAYLLL